MGDTTIFRSDRIVVREHREADLAPLHSLLSDRDCMRFLPELQTNSLSESRENLLVALEEQKANPRTKYFYAIETADHRYAGEVGVTVIREIAGERVGNLGYFLLKEFHGQGIASEAARGVLEYFFERLGFEKIESGCQRANVASEKVLIKIGMRKERELTDRLEYEILKSEWEAQAE